MIFFKDELNVNSQLLFVIILKRNFGFAFFNPLPVICHAEASQRNFLSLVRPFRMTNIVDMVTNLHLIG
jgi:Zn-dependent protease